MMLLVVNDKFNLYPEIAGMVGMKIVNQFKCPGLTQSRKR